MGPGAHQSAHLRDQATETGPLSSRHRHDETAQLSLCALAVPAMPSQSVSEIMARHLRSGVLASNTLGSI